MSEADERIDYIRKRLAMGDAGYGENYNWQDCDALLRALDERTADRDALRAALRRLLGTINIRNALSHDPGCGCVIHEALAALSARRVGERRKYERRG